MEHDTRQKEGVVQDGSGVKVLGYQPPNLKDMLVQPTFDLA